MTARNRFPASYTLLAGIAGAVAWSSPYIIRTFLPSFPAYVSPPYRVPLIEMTISFAAAAGLAAGILLLGASVLSPGGGGPAHKVSPAAAWLALLSAAAGGAFAGLFGFGVGYSQWGYSLLISLDWLDRLPEPFLSVGLALGAALSILITLAFSDLTKPMVPTGGSAAGTALGITLKTLGLALVGRALFGAIAFWSAVVYAPPGLQQLIIFLAGLASGALFGALTWNACTKRGPAQTGADRASAQEGGKPAAARPVGFYRLGFWSAILVAVTAALPLLAVLAFGIIPIPTAAGYGLQNLAGVLYSALTATGTILLMLAFTVLMICISRYASLQRQTWTRSELFIDKLGLFSTAIFLIFSLSATLVDFILEHDLELYRSLTGTAQSLALFADEGGLAILRNGLMGLASLFILPAFRNKGLGGAIRVLIVINGLLTVGGAIGGVISFPGRPAGLFTTVNPLSEIVILPIAAVLIAITFRRAEAKAGDLTWS